MGKTARIIAVLATLLPAAAAAQSQLPNMAPGTVMGVTSGGVARPPSAIPFATLSASLGGIFGAVAPNLVYASPASLPAGAPAMRSLVGADLPAPGASSFGGVQSKTCSTSNWFNTLSTGGVFGCSQPNFTDLAGSIASGQIPAATVALSSLATQANNTVVGNNSGSTASPTALTQTQLTTLINTATSSLSGALPAFPNTTTTYFRGDGTYQTHNCAALTNSGPGCSAAAGQLPGTATNDNASAGNVGEYIESVIASGSAVALTTGVAKDVTTITLTAGDWDVSGNVSYSLGTTTVVNAAFASVSTTLNTVDTTNGRQGGFFWGNGAAPGAGSFEFAVVGPVRFSVSGSTTIHLVALSYFTTSTDSAYGLLRARRIR